MKDLKGNLSTIVGLIVAFCGFLTLLAQSGLDIPQWLLIVAGATPTFAITVLGIFQGKNPDLTSKTKTQLWNISKQK